MAKNPNYTRTLQDKFTIEGHLSEDKKTISYVDSDKIASEISVEKCLEYFADEYIELTIIVKMTHDLGDKAEEE